MLRTKFFIFKEGKENPEEVVNEWLAENSNLEITQLTPVMSVSEHGHYVITIVVLYKAAV